MSFEAASLVATIQLGGAQRTASDLDRVRAQLERTDSLASKLSRTAERTFRGAATAIGVASTAAAVYVGKLMSTGIEYNKLQQTSRAAMNTLMGGAEKANVQMDKLDAFARTSPFSKSVFITAQQQLIGFGQEAEKVIPTLDAMQDAVAAVGGGNQELSELVFILAQIQAAGKITGQDLMQFGQRGVDAATLIGSQMGKTGAEIRSEITNGTLGATEAVDALVAGMKEKFDGAAANVKGTFAGTVDRVNAASRDIGAALAEPFVSKNGGGLAVDWGNQLADVLRAVEGHVSPVVTILMGRAKPAVDGITTSLDKARVQVRSWDSSKVEKGLQTIADNAPGVAAVAGAILGVNSQLLAGLPVVGKFVPAFGPLPGAIAAAALASPALRSELSGLLGAFKPLIPVVVDLAENASGTLNAVLPVVADGIKAVTAVAGPAVDILSKIPTPILTAAAGGLVFNAAFQQTRPLLEGAGKAISATSEFIKASAAVSEATGGQVSTMGAMFHGATGKVTGLGTALKTAFLTNPVGVVITGVTIAAVALTAALANQAQKAREVKERVDEYKNTLDQTTGAITEQTREMVAKKLADTGVTDTLKGLGVQAHAFTDAMLGNSKAADLVRESMMEQGRAAFGLGTSYKQAARVAESLGVSQDTVIDSLLGIGEAQKTVSEAIAAHPQGQQIAKDLDFARRAMGETSTSVRGLNLTLEEQWETAAAAEAEWKAYQDALRRAEASMTDAERSNGRLNEALSIARDVSRDATERIRALKQALGELNGGTKTQAELTRDLNEQALNLADAFAQTDEEGKKLANSLVDASGGIDTTTRAGINLHDQVTRLNDEMLTAITQAVDHAKATGNAAGAMDEGAKAAQPYIDKLREVASEAGLSDDKVNGLIEQMMSTPEVVSFLMTDEGTIDVKQQELIVLAQQILDTPDKEFEVSSDDFPGLEKSLKALGSDIKSIPTGNVKVKKDDGSFTTVEGYLESISRTRYVSIITQMQNSTAPGTMLMKAGGGSVFGPGSDTSDSIHALLSNNEHVWTAAETRGAGGHGNVAMLRSLARSGQLSGLLPGFREGGPVVPIRSSMLPAERVYQVASASVGVDAVASLVAEVRALRASQSSLQGLAISGAMRLVGDGLFEIIDGRIDEAWPSDGGLTSETGF